MASSLSSVSLQSRPTEPKIRQVRKVLNIPEYVVPLAIIYIGHPNRQPEGRCRYNEKRVYWQKYEPDRKHRVKDKPIMGHY